MLRPLVDESQDDTAPLTLVLKYLDADLRRASDEQRLTRQEIKYVARHVLCALHGLHERGYVHSDVKPDNILVNYDGEKARFSQVQLGDCGGTVRADSKYAMKGNLVGTSVFRAPEVHLELPWGPASDIWSFGVTLINLIWGLNFHIFEPPESTADDMYDMMVVAKQHQMFGPFPLSFKESLTAEEQEGLRGIVSLCPQITHFSRVGEREISPVDKEFVLKMLKLDPRDRPSAQSLLDDPWFGEKSERTVGWYAKEEWDKIKARSP